MTHQNSDDGGIIPSWVFGLRTLVGASVTIGSTTYYLVDEPLAFLQAFIVDWIVGGIRTVIGSIGAGILQMWDIVLGALADGFLAVLGALPGDSIFAVLDAIGGVITDLASMAGPFAPFITVAIWAIVWMAFAGSLRVALEVVKWVT